MLWVPHVDIASLCLYERQEVSVHVCVDRAKPVCRAVNACTHMLVQLCMPVSMTLDLHAIYYDICFRVACSCELEFSIQPLLKVLVSRNLLHQGTQT